MSSGAPAVVLVWAGAVLAVAWLCWRVLLPAAVTPSFGFSSYYTSAHLVAAGRLGPEIYDNAWFQQQELALGLRNDIYGTQPPTMALLLLPVVWLPPTVARVVWLALDMVWLGGIGLIAATLARGAGARVGPAAVAAMVILVAVYRPLHAELRYAQVYVLLGLWYALWLYGFVTGRDWLCGAALAALVLAKLAGAPLWLVLLVDRRWRALAWAAGLSAVGLLVTLPAVGLATWSGYLFGRVGDLAANPVFGVTALQTLTSLLRQLFVFDAQYTPAPLMHAPWLATGLWVAAAGALAWFTFAPAEGSMVRWLAQLSGSPLPVLDDLAVRASVRLLTGAAALCLLVPLQPAGEQHHYVVLLVPLLVLVPLAGRLISEAPLAAALGAMAIVLLLLPSYFLDNAAWAGWPRALLAYPRLYAALALWGCLVIWRGAQGYGRALQWGGVKP
jgi:hypothetical protein